MKYLVIAGCTAGVLALVGWTTISPGPSTAVFQGWVEADKVFIGAEDQGRIIRLDVVEGQTVDVGDTLFGLDSATQNAELDAANAAWQETQAKVTRLTARSMRPEELAVLDADREQAEAALKLSERELARAQSLFDSQSASQARLEQARSVFERDQAALDAVRARVKVGHLSGREEDISAAASAAQQAHAQFVEMQARVNRQVVKSVVQGVVHEIYYRKGEILPLGRPAISILPENALKVRFFVPERTLPKVALGQVISIDCDGCASGLRAEVSFIAHEAQFTPPVIYSNEERNKLLFRVEAKPLNPAALRVGQPLSVSFDRQDAK